ncbi:MULTISPECIES: GNAT family N-acetyltransferase [Pseudomonas]|uniref:GNAT family N-acetyltransferase n=1 Tax=Pseudomonas TaxID=286 RepID=UPI00081289ED|nr:MULTISPECIES: GNAT family N-acetyltransferase [unclassified Pseudomonas]MBW8127097.1 GNAT family N-acetyltransferase [Pseudomonas sp. LAP_36]MBW8134882.1 GNAT family N-acetyltransferase [Pseudomonas sp. PAMC 26818]CRM09718.1 ribosomal-protein-alanine acetyltransferase [Pseudomonas sp. 52 E 6]CRM58702.1 ribosomal-protein-alanine acetyltransferase [Pseudomonas sp. 24 R 17]
MLEIKRAAPEDAQVAFDIRLQAIRSQCIGAYTREQMMLWTRGKAEDGYDVLMDKLFYLGCIQGEPVATGMLDLDNNEVGALFVLPEFTGRGYGKAMLDHLENVAQERAIETVVLDATLNAATFYRACGYVGDEQATYHSPSGLALACIPMTKRLSA